MVSVKSTLYLHEPDPMLYYQQKSDTKTFDTTDGKVLKHFKLWSNLPVASSHDYPVQGTWNLEEMLDSGCEISNHIYDFVWWEFNTGNMWGGLSWKRQDHRKQNQFL